MGELGQSVSIGAIIYLQQKKSFTLWVQLSNAI